MIKNLRIEKFSNFDFLNIEKNETWVFRTDKKNKFNVKVKYGKKLDFISLKNESEDTEKEYAKHLKRKAKHYENKSNYKLQRICPICGSKKNEISLTIFKINYLNCKNCKHIFAEKILTEKFINSYYTQSKKLSSVYIDKRKDNFRIQNIVKPKFDWINQIYLSEEKKKIKSILDIGAGAGHFLYYAKKKNVKVAGFEKNIHAIEHCRKNFGISLFQEDFLKTKENKKYDVITMFGLLEYVTNPNEFINVANNHLKKNGLLVIEVPRANSLSTRVQSIKNPTIVRHMDPTSHINCFSDTSLCNLLFYNDFYPIAAWYFGMDSYELFFQLKHLNKYKVFTKKNIELIELLQNICDRSQFCDDIIMIFKRGKSEKKL